MHLNEEELEVLRIIENNSRIDLKDLAKMTDQSDSDIEITLKKLEDMRVIVRYLTVINWAKVDEYHGVTAMIDVKVTQNAASVSMMLQKDLQIQRSRVRLFNVWGL